MEIVLWIVVALLSVQLVFVWWNVRQLPVLSPSPQLAEGRAVDPGDRPRLSVLIPARNEARNISDCLGAVLAAGPDDGSYEVIVLDDRSEDDTYRIAAAAAAADRRVRVIHGEPPPLGWVGKAYACDQLARSAAGRWWLFLDADARLEPGAVIAALEAADRQGSGLITGFPRQVTVTWLEKLAVPMMGFTIGCHLPIRLVRQSPDPRFIAAHGACILIHGQTYDEIGGHAANRSHLVDDMALAREVKKHGYPAALMDVRHIVHMRMYHKASEVWQGYKKNMYAGTGRKPLLLGAVLLLYLLLYLLPVAALALSPFQPAWLLPAALAYGLGVLIKRATDRMQSQPGWLAWCMPASIACFIAIGLSSWLTAGRGKGYEWKGRYYS
ncbi:glycosyltransferase [Paenibacillus sp. 1P07SE]|uniref:glycosyltransferase n=1 Tax=Paenibacillus sp. 1P07SE TaxID=3132209 RepID=UPI0039A55B0E